MALFDVPLSDPHAELHEAARYADMLWRRMDATLKAFVEIAGASLPPEAAERFAARAKEIEEQIW